MAKRKYFLFIKGKRAPKKLLYLREKKDRSVVNDENAKQEETSAKTIVSTVSTRSYSTDSDEHMPSNVASLWSTSVPIPFSQRKMPNKWTKSIGKKNSAFSISSAASKKSRGTIKKKVSKINEEPLHIYKLKRLDAIDEAQHSNLDITSSTESEEEVQSDQSDQSEGDKMEPDGGNTTEREDQTSASSDSNIRMRFDILEALRDIPDCDELVATRSMDQNWGIDERNVEKHEEQQEQQKPGLELEKSQIPLSRSSLASSAESLMPNESTNEALPPKNNAAVLSPSTISPSELESDDESDWGPQEMPHKSSHVPTFRDMSSKSWSSASSPKPIHSTFYVDQLVQGYLDGLIGKVVDIFDKTDYLRTKNLDKSKLLHRLFKELDDYQWERYDNDLLTKRLTEHHLRRFKYSLVTANTSSSIEETHRRRYLGALNELDHWLHRKGQAEEIHLAEKERLLVELERMQLEDNEKLEKMEEIFRNTIFRDSQPSEHLRLVTETALQQMRKKRDVMSATRLILIIKQHNNSYIKQKLDEIEANTGEVKLATYLSAEHDVQQMVTALNNKNAELHRMYMLVKTKVHSISHLRCRRKLLNRTFRVAKNELRKKENHHLELRDKVYTCNLIHNKLLDQIKEVRRKGGIMCYPKLLADFDRTENFIAIKQESVEELRAQHDNLQKKIAIIELKILESKMSASIATSK
ncbi:uncharacterized protein LOC120458452 isoform X1 [Drosophila santomea]|uniref:uncharacterized protein LOC120458452 isoform X1 n=1 Tax=Drosophila santomea TaxID=129105 RepID=UPI001952D8B1|nr:uncharacterized protein LOC120458452 isoform X1 [Drosophila santomea]